MDTWIFAAWRMYDRAMRRACCLSLGLAVACTPGDGSQATDPGTSTSTSTGTGAGPTATPTEPTTTGAVLDTTSGETGAPPVNQQPIAMFTATVQPGELPKAVIFDASASSDPDGTIAGYQWKIAGEQDQGMIVTRPLAAGCHEVELSVADNSAGSGNTKGIVIVAAGEPVMPPVVSIDRAPLAGAVLPRDLATDAGTARFHGFIESSGYTGLRAELLAGDLVSTTSTTALCGATPLEFAVDVPVPSRLTAYTVRLSLVAGDQAVEVARVDDLVAGDIYLVNGQSNAAANPQSGASNENQGPFVRSFGTRTDAGDVADADRVWRLADGDGGGGPASVGQWAVRMGAQLSTTERTPVGILNGARGGMPIEHFQRNDADHADLTTNYGRLLRRTQNAGIDQSVRGILWYQGEADGTDFQKHLDGFLALKADWSEDYPSVERIYVSQIRLGCNVNPIRTQEVQRQLADTFPEITVMASNGLDGHDGCHFFYESGYREFGDHYAVLLGRDLYGAIPQFDVQPPNPAAARFAANGQQIIVTMRNADSVITCEDGAAADFRIHAGGDSIVADCVAQGHELVLTVQGDASMATGINYLGHIGAGPWVKNENGIGMLSFWKVPIAPE